MRESTSFRLSQWSSKRVGYSDSLTLLPACLLARKIQWKDIEMSLPPGGVLLVIPDQQSLISTCMKSVARQLRANGRHCTELDASQFQPITAHSATPH